MRNRSIRFKLSLWFSLVLVTVAGITFAVNLFAGQTVLRGTVRDYLIGAVEENVDKISYVTEESDPLSNAYIPFSEGYLEIDLDFMDVVNDVYTGLYSSEGKLLYGENPLLRKTGTPVFEGSRIWHMKKGGIRYDFYDRKLNIALPGGEVLFIRGIVPDTRSGGQLRDIARLSLFILPVLIFLAVLSGYLVSDRLLSPLRRIERAAGSISRGDDLRKRIDVGKNRDEVGRLTEAFNRMLDRLEDSFERERRFTSDASHELRTPTSVILAEAEYTLEKERPAEEYRESLSVVKKQGEKMKELISDMLDYTRMEQGTERYEMKKENLSALVRELSDQLSLPKTNGITLETEIREGLFVKGNRLLLMRMLQNLVSNAYRYGKEDGRISVCLKEEPEGILLSVSDDGIGIPEEEQEKIFDRFYRGDDARSTPGTGLGLSMVKKIAELHGAEIRVKSSPGEGSTFSVIFPAL